MLNNRGQLSEVMSWIVATLVIITVLLAFIFGSTILAQKTKVLDIEVPKADFESGQDLDLIDAKNFIAHEKATDAQKQIIQNYFGSQNEN